MFEESLDFNPELCTQIMPQMSEAFIANRKEMIIYFENHAEKFIEEF